MSKSRSARRRQKPNFCVDALRANAPKGGTRVTLSRGILLAGASLMVLAAVSSPARAVPIGKGSNGGAGGQSAAAYALQNTQAQAQRAAEQAQRALSRVRNVLQDMQSAQNAARVTAKAAAAQLEMQLGIHNGLHAKGLMPDNGLTLKPPAVPGKDEYVVSDTWQGVGGLSQTSEGGRTIVNVDQTAQKAIANWTNFDVGKDTTLNFNQADASWSILNRVAPSMAPSHILGNINAKGTVLVINQNGIIFHGASQINVGSLTASSLNLSPDKFLSSFITTQWDRVPTFAADAGVAGDIEVKAGARIEAAADGRVMLLGGNVTNEGTIVTPGGQTLLGAGQQAYLAASTDAGMRGLKIELGDGGLATNNGLIVAERGNVTLAGRNVSVGSVPVDGVTTAGVLQSSTTVSANGSIVLQARDDTMITSDNQAQPRRTGDITVADGALLEILPDLTDAQTVAALDLLAPSTIDLYGRTIRIGKDATLIATGGDISLTALTDPLISDVGRTDNSQIYVDSGAILDVSGTRGVQLAMERNFIEVELRGNELRDNPLLKNSFLYGKKVWIDIRDKGKFDDPLMADLDWFEGEPGAWYGSSLFDASGSIASLQRGIGELTSKGGNITLEGRGDIVLRQGSLLNVSGGMLEFADGYGRITFLTGADGRKVPIGAANSILNYTGLAGTFTRNHERWGVTETWTSFFAREGFAQQGYTEGQRAGIINIVAPRVALDGDILAVAEAGQRQLAKDDLPTGGTLILGDGNLNSVVLQEQAAILTDTFSPSQTLQNDFTTVLSTDKLSVSGLSALEIYSNRAASIADDARLDLGEHGNLTVSSSSITVDGSVRAAGGDITLIGSSGIHLGGNAALDVSGTWTNAFVDGALPATVDGGSITLRTAEVTLTNDGAQVRNIQGSAGGTIVIDDGAVIDVSGAGRVGFDGKLASLGKAGSIIIGASSLDLSEHADLRGYALATPTQAGRGGSLTLIGRGVQQFVNQEFLTRGGFASFSLDGVDSLTVAPGLKIVLAPQSRLLSNDYFSRTSGTALEKLGTLDVLPEGIRAPSSLSLRAGLVLLTTGQMGSNLLNITGSVSVGAGSLIDTGVGGSVMLAAPDLVWIDGEIKARGGAVSAVLLAPANLSAATPAPSQAERQDRAIWLGENAVFDVSGALRPSWNPYGWRSGDVLAGGTVTLDASRGGYVVTEAGSLIDVSGSLAELDMTNYSGGGLGPKTPVRPQTVWSDAGSVNVLARDGAWLDGSYNARVLAPQAEAGSFYLGLGTTLSPSDNPLLARIIELRQNRAPALPSGLRPGDSLGPIDRPAGVATNIPLQRVPTRTAYVSADLLSEGGFSSISLESRSEIALMDNVSLSAARSIILNAPAIRVGTIYRTEDQVLWGDSPDLIGIGVPGTPVPQEWLDQNVCSFDPAYCTIAPGGWEHPITARVSAAYVSIGAPNLPDTPAVSPTLNQGTLVVEAGSLLAIGNRTALLDIENAEFISGGDIQLGQSFSAGSEGSNGATGSLLAAGDLTFKARQIYPASGKAFSISTTGADATVTILPGEDASATLPWSVGGSLTINAPHIVHKGVLRAPLGQITLDAGSGGNVTLAGGSIIDVSAHGRILPYGTVMGGEWYVDLGIKDLLEAMPAAKVTLRGDTVDIQAGATLDLSGGGNITAYDFIPGTGGSRDVLASRGAYAVVPGAQPVAAPSSTAAPGQIAVGTSVYLSGVPGLAAGWYTLMPAEYALLPGAFRVQLAGSANDRSAGMVNARPDGAYLVSGLQGSSLSGSRDSRTSMFLVMPGEVARAYTEYKEYSGNNHFAEAAQAADRAAPPLAVDGGQLVLNAIRSLTLDGRFNLAGGKGGRGGLVDIAAESIAIVSEGDAPVADYALTVNAQSLSEMGAQSLLLGGTRQSTADGYVLTPTAGKILVANDGGSALTGSEILLLAKSDVVGGLGGIEGTGAITIEAGAVINVTGEPNGVASVPYIVGNSFNTDPQGTGMGALLAVSNATDFVVQRYDVRANGPDMAGTITVAAGATITSSGLVLFDATAESVLDRSAVIRGRSLGVSSSAISLGDAAPGTLGFIANAETLAALSSAERLVLRSYGTIDFYNGGSFDPRDPATGLSSVKELVLDAAALRQQSAGTINLGAEHLTLRNTAGVLAAGDDPSGVAGLLNITASRFEVGLGASAILGFAQVDVDAGIVLLSGTGSLTAGGSAQTTLNVRTPLVATATGADQRLIATGALRLDPGAAPLTDDMAALVGIGGRLALQGDTVDVATQVRLPAGALSVEAIGNLTVASGARLDVSGRDQAFFDQIRTLPAGEIALTSQTGDVLVASGALLDLSDPKGGGKLTVTLPDGAFNLLGDARGGSFAMDTGAISGGFGVLQAALNRGGFAISRDFRIRSGSIVIDGETRTRSFTLSTDQGSITVAGTIDASGPTGGRIALSAAGGVVLADGSHLTVAGDDFDGAGKGGSILLSAGAHRVVDGQNVSDPSAVLDIRSGSRIDLGVAGLNAGTLHLRAPQTADGTDLRINAIRGTVTGAGSILAEGVRVYDLTGTDGVITIDLQNQVKADAQVFASHTMAIKARLLADNTALVSATSVLPGAEIINASADVPTSIDGLLDPGGVLDLLVGIPVVFPDGFQGGAISALLEATIEINASSSGTALHLNTSSQIVTIPPGSSVLLPNGAAANGISFTNQETLVVRPDGTQTQNFGNMYSQGYPQSLPAGTRIVFPAGGSFQIGTTSTPINVSLSAGVFRATQGTQVTGLPAGSSLASIGQPTTVNASTSAPVTVRVPTDSAFGAAGLTLMAPENAPAALTLRDAGVSRVSIAAGTALTLSQGGRIQVTAAGGIYVGGVRVQSFVAGDTVEVPQGAEVRLDDAGMVTTQSAELRILVQAGATYSIASVDPHRTITMITTSSALSMSAGASITVTSLTTATSFSMHSTVAATVLRPDGTQRTTMSANTSVSINTGETIVLSAAGTLTLDTRARTLDVQINNGTVVGTGTTQDISFALPAVIATPSSVSPDLVLRAVDPGDPTLPVLGWDLADYRFGPEQVPGILTLRAAGNLRIQGSLSDGFSYGNNKLLSSQYFAQGGLIDDRSWSYNLVGGADFAAASMTAVQPLFQLDALKGNVRIEANRLGDTAVRTGSGDITVAAGRDIALVAVVDTAGAPDYFASLYTAGRPADQQIASGAAFSLLGDDRRILSGGDFWLTYGGGDIRLSAGRDMVGNGRSAVVGKYSQEISDWLKTQGNVNAATGAYTVTTGWGVSPNAVRSGSAFLGLRDAVAALGGGNVTVDVGRDSLGMTYASANSGIYDGISPQDATVQTVGGGDVRLTTGRDALGSIVYIAAGDGVIRVGRKMSYVMDVSGKEFGTRFALGDATIDALARGNAEVGSVYTPTMLYRWSEVLPYFSTFTENTAVTLQSIAGDVGVMTQIGGQNGNASYNDRAFSLFPAKVEAVAYNGNIAVGLRQARLEMMPATESNLTLLAQNSVNLIGTIGMSDADPAVFERPLVLNSSPWATSRFGVALSDSLPYEAARDRSLSHSADLLHADDPEPIRIYAVNGDITGRSYPVERRDGTWTSERVVSFANYLSLIKPAHLRAGRDIVDISLLTQNFTPDQTTLIQAGRDFIFSKRLDINTGLDRRAGTAGGDHGTQPFAQPRRRHPHAGQPAQPLSA